MPEMQDVLTSEERWNHFYGDGKIDRVPVLSFATMYSGLHQGLTSEQYYFDIEKGFDAQKAIIEREGFDDSPCLDIPNAEVLDFGGSLAFANRERMELPTVERYPINSEVEAEDYVLPNVQDRLYTQKRIEFYDYARSVGQTGVGIGLGSPFTLVNYLVEPTLLMSWLVKRRDLVEKLILVVMDYLSQTADILIERYGVENCSASANVPFESNNMISARMFERFSLPSLVEMYEVARNKGIKSYGLHICGNHMKTLHYFKELNLRDRSFISTDERNTIEEVARVLGEGNVVAGNVSCENLVSATSDEVYRESYQLVETMRYHPGGFVLMPSCDLPINANPDNLKAMLQAAIDCGF